MERVKSEKLMGYRGVACVCVFLSHCTGLIPSHGSWGGIGVSMFMVLSGYLAWLTKSKEDFDTHIFQVGVKYAWRKIKEFYPLYIVMMLVAVPYSFQVAAYTIEMGVRYAVVDLLLLQSYIPNPSYALSYNWPSWYLSTTILFYLLMPFCVTSIRNIKERKKCVALLVGIILFQIIFCAMWIPRYTVGKTFSYWCLYINPFFRLGDFLIGILAGRIQEEGWLKINVISEVMTIGLFIVSFFGYKFLPNPLMCGCLYTPIACALLVHMVDDNGKILKHVKLRWLQKIGEISFEIYLIHRMVIAYSGRFTGYTQYKSVRFLFAVVTTYILAVIVNKVKKKRRQDKKC